MAKSVYAGVGGVARKVKKIYVGVGGVARKVKKGYVGVGGVARPFMSGELEYYGTLQSLGTLRSGFAATSNPSYAIFAGGQADGVSSTAVDAYNSAGSRTAAPAFAAGRERHSAAGVGRYALFAGGWERLGSGNVTYRNEVYSYDQALARGSPPALGQARDSLTGASTSGHALFAGGTTSTASGSTVATVDSYDSSLSRGSPAQLSSARYGPTGLSFLGRAIFAGGNSGSGGVNAFEVYDSTLSKTNPSTLSANSHGWPAAVAGKFALFLTQGITVDVFDENFARTTSLPTPKQLYNSAGASVGSYGLFAAGQDSSWNYLSEVYAYKGDLTRTTLSLREGRASAMAASIGELAIFAGGSLQSGATSLVEAFTADD